MRILLVEDDATTSKSIEMLLSHASLNMYTTDLGEEAIDLAKLSDFDLILLDLKLPVFSLRYFKFLTIWMINCSNSTLS